jgi:hypothetical protein
LIAVWFGFDNTSATAPTINSVDTACGAPPWALAIVDRVAVFALDRLDRTRDPLDLVLPEW